MRNLFRIWIAGYELTPGVGKYGVVAALRNASGVTAMTVAVVELIR